LPDQDEELKEKFPLHISGVEGLKDLVGLHAGLSVSAISHHYSATCSSLPLTQKQCAILWIVEQNAGISQTDIGRILHTDRATIMALTNKLQEMGYLERLPSPNDRRRLGLALLPAGGTVLEEAKAVISSHEKWVKRNLSEREVKRLNQLLEKVHSL